MIAFFNGSGMVIRLNEDDRVRINEVKRVEALFTREEKLKLELRVSEDIHSGFLEEPGFHIEYDERKNKYLVALSPKRFEELTNPADPIIEGGYFVSRSQFDRVDITFWK